MKFPLTLAITVTLLWLGILIFCLYGTYRVVMG